MRCVARTPLLTRSLSSADREETQELAWKQCMSDSGVLLSYRYAQPPELPEIGLESSHRIETPR